MGMGMGMGMGLAAVGSEGWVVPQAQYNNSQLYFVLYHKGEVIGFRLFRATGLAFAIRPKDIMQHVYSCKTQQNC